MLETCKNLVVVRILLLYAHRDSSDFTVRSWGHYKLPRYISLGFLKWQGVPLNSPSHARAWLNIETYGDLGILHDLRNPVHNVIYILYKKYKGICLQPVRKWCLSMLEHQIWGYGMFKQTQLSKPLFGLSNPSLGCFTTNFCWCLLVKPPFCLSNL